MKSGRLYRVALGLLLGAVTFVAKAAPFTGPVELRVDDLKTPLGIDDAAPRFSWQLQDPARGARQTAYELQVASQAELLSENKADVWDSGRIASSESGNVHYAGPAVAPSTRYFWRVKVWDAAGKPYPESETSWWETGLLTQDAWRGQWIGYETAEESAVRNAAAVWIASPDAKALAEEEGKGQHFAYRATVTLTKPIRHAVLYATGQDTVSAWIDGAPVATAGTLPPWMQMPWRKFIRVDVTGNIRQGSNTIAIEPVHYLVNPNGMVTEDAPPMIATLVVEYTDGTWATFASNPDWKVATHAASGWQKNSFDDSAWKSAMAFAPDPGSTADPLGHPWIPDSVKTLRRSFTVNKPVKSARLYATALGAYDMGLNEWWGTGDQVFAPGWTDYRERVYYQTYDVTVQLRQGKNAISAMLAPGWY